MMNLLKVLIVILGVFSSEIAAAQTFPSRNITIVVPFAAGSGTDTAARIVGKQLEEQLGVSIIIDNRVGAAGSLGAGFVARATPDGHTLLLATNSTHGANPSLFKNLPYDAKRDFTAIGRIAAFAYFLLVNREVPVRTVQELVAYAKANPDKVSYGTGTSTNLVMAETLKRDTNISILKVPYKSNPPALADLISGQTSMMFLDIASSIAYVRAGTLRVLAVTSQARSALAPDTPTMDETVLPGFAMEAWTGLVAPVGTASNIVNRLNVALAVVLAKPEVKERLALLGAEVSPDTPAEFKDYIQAEVDKWARLVKAAEIEPQ
jgi:tripartite-type tricarboxylate transporter receptor subunit TctC